MDGTFNKSRLRENFKELFVKWWSCDNILPNSQTEGL